MSATEATTPVVKARWWRRVEAWRRLGSDAAAFAVGGTAAVISWTHIVYVALTYGSKHQAMWTANLYPVSIDGMMVVGVIKAADDRSTGREVRGWARVATWLGGVLSIAAQVTSAWPDGWVARAVATVPSGTLIVVVEVMSRRGRIAAGKRGRWARLWSKVTDVPTASTPIEVPAPVVVAAVDPAPLVPVFTAEVSEPVTEAPVRPAVRVVRRRGRAGVPYTDLVPSDGAADLSEADTDMVSS